MNLSARYNNGPCIRLARRKFEFTNKNLTEEKIACEQAPVGDSRVQSRANGMNRERSGEEGVCMGGSPASHSLRSRSHDALTPIRSLAEFFSDLAGSLLAG